MKRIAKNGFFRTILLAGILLGLAILFFLVDHRRQRRHMW